MRIAVLGATGMIGTHVVHQALARGHEVVAVSRRGAAVPGAPSVESRIADIANISTLRDALHDVEVVIHCAAYYPNTYRKTAHEIETAQAEATSFYTACSSLPLRRIVFVGAAIAVPRNQDGSPSDGQRSFAERPADQNAYLQVKWLQDFLARQAAANGAPVVIGVPSMTFGEYDPGNSNGRFILGLAHRQMRGFVNSKRNVVYAGDAGRGLVLAAESGVTGRRYLFTGENLTMAEIMQKISTLVSEPSPRETPLRLISFMRKMQIINHTLLNGREPAISDTAIAVMSSGQFLDGTVAQRELGYRSEISADEAIERAIKWFRSSGRLPAEASGQSDDSKTDGRSQQ